MKEQNHMSEPIDPREGHSEKPTPAPISEQSPGVTPLRPDVPSRARGQAPEVLPDIHSVQEDDPQPAEFSDVLIAKSPFLQELFAGKDLTPEEKAEMKDFMNATLDPNATSDEIIEAAQQLGIAKEHLPLLLRGRNVSEDVITAVMQGVDALPSDSDLLPPAPLKEYQDVEKAFEALRNEGSDLEEDEIAAKEKQLIDMIKRGQGLLDEEASAVGAEDEQRPEGTDVEPRTKRKIAFNILAFIIIAYLAGLRAVANSAGGAGGKH